MSFLRPSRAAAPPPLPTVVYLDAGTRVVRRAPGVLMLRAARATFSFGLSLVPLLLAGGVWGLATAGPDQRASALTALTLPVGAGAEEASGALPWLILPFAALLWALLRAPFDAAYRAGLRRAIRGQGDSGSPARSLLRSLGLVTAIHSLAAILAVAAASRVAERAIELLRQEERVADGQRLLFLIVFGLSLALGTIRAWADLAAAHLAWIPAHPGRAMRSALVALPSDPRAWFGWLLSRTLVGAITWSVAVPSLALLGQQPPAPAVAIGVALVLALTALVFRHVAATVLDATATAIAGHRMGSVEGDTVAEPEGVDLSAGAIPSGAQVTHDPPVRGIFEAGGDGGPIPIAFAQFDSPGGEEVPAMRDGEEAGEPIRAVAPVGAPLFANALPLAGGHDVDAGVEAGAGIGPHTLADLSARDGSLSSVADVEEGSVPDRARAGENRTASEPARALADLSVECGPAVFRTEGGAREVVWRPLAAPR